MRTFLSLACILVFAELGAANGAGFAAEAKVTPVQKVIQLLEGMLKEGEEAKKKEQVQYAAFHQWCTNIDQEKQKAINTAMEEIEKLNAEIDVQKEAIVEQTDRIHEATQDISFNEGEMHTASEVREKENGSYMETHEDYSESIDAIRRAIEVLKSRAKDVPQAAELLQKAKMIPEKSRKIINAFLAQGEDREEDLETIGLSAPEANAYEFQSQKVIDLLAELKVKFEEERSKLGTTETGSQQEFEKLQLDRKNKIQDAKATIDRATQFKAEAEGYKAKAEGELASVTKGKEADLLYRTDLVADCQAKEEEFGKRQKLRADEAEALTKAIEIMKGDSVSGAAEKHLPQLAQQKSAKGKTAVALVQLRSSTRSRAPVQKRVATLLRTKAQELHSRVLSAVAERAEADPFVKVRKMISDMITKLEAEAAEEATHKAWCDDELKSNKETRTAKTEIVEGATIKIDELSASNTILAEEIGVLSQDIADIDKAVAEKTELRNKEKTENEATIKDAEEAQTAVSQALQVLRDFYGGSLLQKKKQGKQPEVFGDERYGEGSSGMSAQGKGVIGMLEVILSDFDRLEQETTDAEAAAETEYTQFMEDTAADKEAKMSELKEKQTTKKSQENDIVVEKDTLLQAQKILESAEKEFDNLKESCLNPTSTYEERVKRREEEIQSLQEALDILNGKELP